MNETDKQHRDRLAGNVTADIPLAGLIKLKIILARHHLDDLDRDSRVRLMDQPRQLGFDAAPDNVDIHV